MTRKLQSHMLSEWKIRIQPISHSKFQALSTVLHGLHEKGKGRICSMSATTYQGHESVSRHLSQLKC